MPLQIVQDLLRKHRLVEHMLQSHSQSRRQLIASLTHKQHMAELQAMLSRLVPSEIGAILAALPEADAKLVWTQIEAARQDEILWEMPNQQRVALVGEGEPYFGDGTLSAYHLVEGRLAKVAIRCRLDLETITPVWIDLLAPNKSQRRLLSQHYGLDLPNATELGDLEASARYYVNQEQIYIHSDFLLDREGDSRTVPVLFVLTGACLFSVRSEELPVFRLQRLRARTQPGMVNDGKDILLDLYSAEAEYSADALEEIYLALEAVSKQVLSQDVSDEIAAKILADIAELEDLNGRIRRNMLDTQRAVSFLLRRKLLSKEQQDDVQQILRDIDSLNSHTAFLFDKINFLLDATVGFININQNKVVKIFSVASVALLPPTLIATIYGMNFQYMPELAWELGYPFALTLMLISVVVPFIYFKRKGWLA